MTSTPPPTWALLRALHAQPDRLGADATGYDPAAEVDSMATQAMGLAYQATKSDSSESVVRHALIEAFKLLNHAMAIAVRHGLDMAGLVIEELSTRVADAIAVLGRGTGQAAEAILGGKPRDLANDVQLFALLGLVGAGFLLTTPGGIALAGALPEAAPAIAAIFK